MSFACSQLPGTIFAAALFCGSAASAAVFSDIHDFNLADGAFPKTALVIGANGMLYGTTNRGGATGLGTIFSFDPKSGALTTLHSFTGGVDGAGPEGNLVLSKQNGGLYSTTHGGGQYNLGTIFKLDRATNTLTTQFSFSGPDGALPQAGLVFDAAGTIYGTTYEGGSTYAGTASSATKIEPLDPPASGLGTVFKFDPVTRTETVLHSFTGEDGANPRASMVFDNAGALYGTTVMGGSSNVGAVFKLDTVTRDLTVLQNFAGWNGADPWTDALVFDTAGVLYGATRSGAGTGCGGTGCGLLFKLHPKSKTMTTLHSFIGPEGASPRSGLIFTNQKLLYGTTYIGGTYNYGTVYKINPASGVETVLHHFAGADGANPRADLVYDKSGVLYGATHSGGAYGYGTLFKIIP